jgi:hypothetical protein
MLAVIGLVDVLELDERLQAMTFRLHEPHDR